jgi:hypothetical protein
MRIFDRQDILTEMRVENLTRCTAVENPGEGVAEVLAKILKGVHGWDEVD